TPDGHRTTRPRWRRRARSERLDEQNAALTGSVVVLHLVLDLEAETPVEGQRTRVDGSGDAADGRAAVLPRHGEEPLVQLACEAGAAVLRRDAGNVDVR